MGSPRDGRSVARGQLQASSINGGVRTVDGRRSGATAPAWAQSTENAGLEPLILNSLFRALGRFGLGICCPGSGLLLAQHFHINAGATQPKMGAPLFFANGTSWDSHSGFVIRLNPTNSPAYGPIYLGGNEITFTSLPATLDNGGPDRFAALPGTHVNQVAVSVDGPIGGVFSFWDSYDGFFEATEITFSLPVGTRSGTNQFSLSENDGSPSADPYGHIHGRKFSVNLPGLYRVGFRLVDTSANGPGGGPVQSPSELTYFYFQAGTTLSPSIPGGNPGGTGEPETLFFATSANRNYWIQATTSLAVPTQWSTVGGPIPGSGRLETWVPSSPPTGVRFYRLQVE